MKNLFYVIVIIIVIWSCTTDKSPCLKGWGENVVVTEMVNDFEHVVVNDIFNINLQKDTSSFVKIATGENLVGQVHCDSRGDTLIIDQSISCKWARSYDKVDISIHYRQLHDILLNAPCLLTNDQEYTDSILKIYVENEMTEIDMRVDNQRFEVLNRYNANGYFNIEGHTDFLIVILDGGGIFDGRDFDADLGILKNFSIGDITVGVNDYMYAELTSTGNIYYKGDPVIKDSILGTGRLIKLE